MAYDDRWRQDRNRQDNDTRFGGRDEGRGFGGDYDRDRNASRYGDRRPNSLPYSQEESFGRGSRDDGGRDFGQRDLGQRDFGGGFDRNDRYGVGSYGRDEARGASQYGYGSDRGQGSYGGSSFTDRQSGSFGRDRDDYGRRSASELGFGRPASGYGREGYGSDYGRDPRSQERGFLERAGDEVASWFGSDEAERRRRQDAQDDRYGQHRGRGPKSYQRSDERIRDDINDRLTDDHHLDASEIEVQVTGREVTLSGTVGNRQDKRRAEDLAESVSGVTHVQNNLRVQNGAADWSGAQRGQTTFDTASAGGARSTTTAELGDTAATTRRVGEKTA